MGADMKNPRTTILFLLPLTILWSAMHLWAANTEMRFRLETQVDGQILAAQAAGKAHIRNLAVAPDGQSIAVLYEQDGSSARGLRLAIYDTQTESVKQRAIIGSSEEASPAYLASGIKQAVLFSPDQKYLIVQDVHAVGVLEGQTLRTLYTTSSHSPAFQVAIHTEIDQSGAHLIITYGSGSTFAREFQTEVLDLHSGKHLASWPSSDIVQSISPDGKLAAAPDRSHYNTGGVTDLQIIDVQTGAKIKTIPLDYRFKDHKQHESGSVTARFLDNDEIVVSPDNMVDDTGHHSGASLEIIRISDGKVIRCITPMNFGPTGELAVSPDRRYFATVSAYADPKVILSDGRLPNPHKPEVLIGEKDHQVPLAVVPNPEGFGLLGNELMPSLSSGASVLAVAQDGKVGVYRRIN
jgi:hypothetical protein